MVEVYVKTSEEEVEKVNKKNEWAKFLNGDESKGTRAVENLRKQKILQVSSRQRRVIRNG